MHNTPRRLAMFILCALLLGGCAIPKVIVHDDALSPEEHLRLGVSYEEQGEFDLAKEQYWNATDIPEAWLLLGNVAFQQERWEDAESRYVRAIHEMPEDPRPLNNFAWLLLTRNERLDRAESLAREALALSPPEDAAQYQDTLDAILAAKAKNGE